MRLACIANSIALIALLVDPIPVESRNFAPIMAAVQLTPTTPRLLLPTAPIVPDTCVPCWLSSNGLQVLVIALNPWLPAGQVIAAPPIFTVNALGADHTLVAKSGWL